MFLSLQQVFPFQHGSHGPSCIKCYSSFTCTVVQNLYQNILNVRFSHQFSLHCGTGIVLEDFYICGTMDSCSLFPVLFPPEVLGWECTCQGAQRDACMRMCDSVGHMQVRQQAPLQSCHKTRRKSQQLTWFIARNAFSSLPQLLSLLSLFSWLKQTGLHRSTSDIFDFCC